MNDTISRQAAIYAIDEQIERCDKSLSSFDISLKDTFAVKVERASLVAFREMLEYLPSAQPEIIQCKDCKFSRMTNDGKHCKYCDQFTDDYGRMMEMYFEANFYCGFAERRNGTNE